MAMNRGISASARRVLFGVNVLLQSALAIVVVVGIIWVAGRWKWGPEWADWTSSGVNSLSPRTTQLLRGLDEDIRLTTLFAEPDKEREPLQRKRWREMKDLLDLYDSVGGAHVTTRMIEPTLEKAETEKLLGRLRELPAYRDEARPHAEALERFPEISEQIKTVATADFQRAQELSATDQRLIQDRNFNIVRNNWQVIIEQADRITEQITELSHAEVPRYGQAIRDVREYLTNSRLRFQDAADWLSGDALTSVGVEGESRTFFEQTPARYERVLADIDALLAQTENLADVKLEEIYGELTRWRSGAPVLVEGENEARVVSFWELWQQPSGPGAPPGPDGDDREFVAEAAISSAILQLTQKDKTAVIFTRFGGPSPIRPDFSQMNQMMRQMPTAPYQVLAEVLEKGNFLTEDWDVSKDKTPPTVEGAGRTIYVVFPPEPPPRPNPMQPSPQAGMTPEDRKIIEDAVEASGMAIFLAGWMPPTSPMPGAAGAYEFASYLKSDWGVDVRSKYLTLQFTPHPEKPGWWVPAGRQPWLISTDRAARLTDHPLAQPSQADRAAFRLVSPVEIVPEGQRPAGVTVEVLAEIRATDDVWAVDDPRRFDEELRQNQGIRPAESDFAAPFPFAVTATNEAGKKIIVFGSEEFASDALAQASGLSQVGNALVLGPLYPANSDLFVNGLHWLTGEADRIAVGPRRGDAPRLKELDEAWAARLPWFLVGAWPAVALVVALGVWVVRRR